MKATKQKQTVAPILTAMLGKKIVFNGKFAFREQERLAALTEGQQGIVLEDLDSSVDYLVLADATAGKTIQKKAASLNAKGATIQVLDASAYLPMVQPGEAKLLEIIRGGTANLLIFEKVTGEQLHSRFGANLQAQFTITGETFDGADLSGFSFNRIAFDHCSFRDCVLNNTNFSTVKNCDFTGSSGNEVYFGNSEANRFCTARFAKPRFYHHLVGNDFSAGQFDGAVFSADSWRPNAGNTAVTENAAFTKSSLRGSQFSGRSFKSPDFDHADLSGASLASCNFENASFRNAALENAVLAECSLTKANFAGADLRKVNFAGSDLTDAKFDGADVLNCNFRGAKLDGVDLSKARNYDPKASVLGTVGNALMEIDALAKTDSRVEVSFLVRTDDQEEGEEVGVDCWLMSFGKLRRYEHFVRAPQSLMTGRLRNAQGMPFSKAMLNLANLVGNRKLRYETVKVKSLRSPKKAGELRTLVMRGIAEAFNQPVPPEDELAIAVKKFKEDEKEKDAVNRERREAAKKLAEKQKLTAKRQIAKKIEKEVGKVTDIATFLKALELRADRSKIDKATKMLKAEKFQLFNDITETHLNGVVKSQTDADLVYACRIESDGQYACCTQNLNICGGLRGSICKHLLVLIIGLVKAGQLDPTSIDTWIAKTHDTKPELNKETMGEIFIRYKGAEAGEVDWRPTETVPEDYYAV